MVLVTDDDEVICSLVERSLRGIEFTVIAASNCRDGFELGKENQPDVFLLDIMMADIDGLKMSSFMNENPLIIHIPIIFLTGRRSQDRLRFAVNAGAAGYITQPISPAKLLKRLRKVTMR
jgi:DNA-binding response OmpR family regulator